MASNFRRIVLHVTAEDKKAIKGKAKEMGLSVSDLLLRGALAYEFSQSDEAIDALAGAASQAVERAGVAIEDALDFIEASNQRITLMELGAAGRMES